MQPREAQDKQSVSTSPTANGAAVLRTEVEWAYLLQKALHAVRYELSHRPARTWLPLRGLKRLLE